MKIIVLDGYTLNPGDLSWQELEKLGECTIYDRTQPDELLERANGAEILMTNKTVISRENIEKLPDLKCIGVLATGYNVVDIAAARERKIPVTNVPSYGTGAVAQMVFAHLLNLCQQVAHHSRTVSAGRWSKSPDFCYWDFPLVELSGLTMGIVGYGQIGRAVAELSKAFGMRVIFYDVRDPGELPPGVSSVDLQRLFTESDVVSLHCPLTEENHRFVDSNLLSLMKPTAFLINTSRGPLIDEDALFQALETGRIAGAGLDVLEREPPTYNCPLMKARNCFITPHIAWATQSARERLMAIAVENVRSFMAGNPVNVVND